MVVPAEWFKEWFSSPYYHQLYLHRDEQAAAFTEPLLKYLQPAPGSLILDIACGHGRYSGMLAGKGFDVTGIDLAFNSIREARKTEGDNLHFFQHDLRLPFWINYFNYAFNFFTPFGYFRTERENSNAVRTIAGSLQTGGALVLDYLNVHYEEDHLVHITDQEIDGVNFHLTKWFDETHFFKKITVEDEQLNEPLVFTEKVAKFTLGDFNDMFSFHHLQIQEVFGDYNFESYHVKRSPRLIMVARKI